jgi:uncharacterized protein (DUF1015 family)
VAIVRPFRALRPFPDQAASVAAVPYDVVSTDEARALASGKPLSFLHVSRAEIDLPPGSDPHAPEVYRKAAANFDALTASAPLTIEDHPSLYLYRLRMAGHEQIGLVATCSIDEYDSDLIRKHERTRKDKEDDRTQHILSLLAQTGPVFLTYVTNPLIDVIVSDAIVGAPLFDFTAEDGVQHSIWRVDTGSKEAFTSAFLEVPYLYIADGHHRAKSASRAREALASGNKEHTGNEEYNFFQCVLFPADQVKILPYNRVVRQLNGLTNEEFLKKIEVEFEVTPDAPAEPPARGLMSMYLGGRWFGLNLRKEVTKPIRAIDSLDVSILQDKLLAPVLEIEDVRTDPRIDFVGGIRGVGEIERIVDSGKAVVGFSLFPTTVDDLMHISDVGEIMPPKSTWFEPKLRDGLLIHLI